ncbi:MAG: hypothetical protein M3173_05915, partial [Chloroflexota bacterium]|nr:hypothetical protein [Chloroflexota bacterium]
MRRRGCLVSFGALALLSLVCCLVVWFVALPQFQESIAHDIRDGLATEVARQIDRTGVQVDPGTHTISMAALEEELQNTPGLGNIEDMEFFADNGELALTFGSQGQELGYAGEPLAVDGRMELVNVESTGGGFLDQFFPAEELAGAVES